MIIKAGIKKELLSFSRTFKMWAILITIIAFAFIDPALIKLIGTLGASISQAQAPDVSQQSIVSTSSDAGELTSSLDLGSLSSPEYAIASTLGDLTGLCFLILMLLLMPAAGGELKKRATIIPNCSGMTPGHYLIPKFIFYPLFVFAASFVAVICAGFMAGALFGRMPEFGNILLLGAMTGVYMIFAVCLYLCLGLSTSKAGMAVAVSYVGTTILELLFTGFGAEKFTPFALRTEALSVLYGEIDAVNILGSMGVLLVLSLIFFFVTMMVLSAKRIDNLGEESGAL